MTLGQGLKGKYDYVELTIEPRGDQWCLILTDTRHGESVEDEEQYETVAEAQEAALTLAQRHINVQHNDTLLTNEIISWRRL